MQSEVVCCWCLLDHALLGVIAECLPLFRLINAGLTNRQLDLDVVQDCDGVAIGHIDDLAQQRIGLHLNHQEQRQRSGR